MPIKPQRNKSIRRPKSGRKPLGNNKCDIDIMTRMNTSEKESLVKLAKIYNVNLEKRGQQGPFVRKLLLEKIGVLQEQNVFASKNQKEKVLPNAAEIIAYEIHKIGININQITKTINQKNKKSISAGNEKLLQQLKNKLDLVYENLNVILSDDS